MANKFFSGEKASKAEAKAALEEHINRVYDQPFHIRFVSDDGGNLLEVIIEREHVREQIDEGTWDLIDTGPKWMGWRRVTLKVPPGYIDAIILAVKRDDY